MLYALPCTPKQVSSLQSAFQKCVCVIQMFAQKPPQGESLDKLYHYLIKIHKRTIFLICQNEKFFFILQVKNLQLKLNGQLFVNVSVTKANTRYATTTPQQKASFSRAIKFLKRTIKVKMLGLFFTYGLNPLT